MKNAIFETSARSRERRYRTAAELAEEGEVRAARVGCRDGQDAVTAAAEMAARETSEARRYRSFHGIDYADLSIYALVLDTAAQNAEQVAERIAARLKAGKP